MRASSVLAERQRRGNHDALAAAIEPVARQLLGEPNSRLSRRGELRFGSRGSLSIVPGRGGWHDHAAGEGGGTLDLIARETGRHGADARAWLRDNLESGTLPDRPAPVPFSDADGRFWEACSPIDPGDEAGRCLAARCCALPHRDGDLRWHPDLRHPSGHRGPALVALVTDARTCEPMTLHRTWIAGNGSGRKASVDPPRLLLPGHAKAGGVVRLWPDDAVTLGLGIGEGIETTLTLARGFTPVWSCLDAGNLAALPYLYPIESITVAVDNDAAGVRAFAALSERWTAAGAEVRGILAPRPGADLNDWAEGVDNAAL